MLIVMKMDATTEQVESVVKRVEDRGLKANPIPGAQRTAIGITGNLGVVEPTHFESLPGVLEVISVSHPYKLVSREFQPHDSVVDVGEVNGVSFGGPGLVVIAGPCSVESYEQTSRIAARVKAAGAQMLRGGAFKPRTSPYSFQGLGIEGLKILARVREETGLPVVTEATDIDVLDAVAEYSDMVQIGARNMQNYTLLKRAGRCGRPVLLKRGMNATITELLLAAEYLLDDVAEYSDMVQIGARNMQNYTLLKRAGRCGRPVLLKRGMNATITELLLAAEYLLDEGNRDVVLCERGIRTFADHTRNTLDVSAVPAVQRISHLPIICDPSHASGQRSKVLALARASVAAGADGLMVEVHDHPNQALSDGAQAIVPDELDLLMEQTRALAPVLERTLPAAPASAAAR